MTVKFEQDIKPGQGCDAVVELFCTNRGKHPKRHIELMKRDGRRWFTFSEEWGSTAKESYDAWLGELLNRGVPLGDKLMERNGRLDSRYRRGLRETKGGWRAECPTCPHPRDFPGVTIFRVLDKCAEQDLSAFDVSYR